MTLVIHLYLFSLRAGLLLSLGKAIMVCMMRIQPLSLAPKSLYQFPFLWLLDLPGCTLSAAPADASTRNALSPNLPVAGAAFHHDGQCPGLLLSPEPSQLFLTLVTLSHIPVLSSYHARSETPLFTCFFAVCPCQLKRQLHEGRCPISFTVFTPVPRTASST